MNATLHVFPTLKCNSGCEYCAILPGRGQIDRFDGRYTIPEKWAQVLSMRNPKALYLTGGEPMLFQGLDMLINAVKCPTWIYTNGSGDFVTLLLRVKRIDRLRFRLSFHPHLGFKRTLQIADTFREHNVGFSLHAVETTPQVKEWVKRFAVAGHSLALDPNFNALPWWSGQTEVVCNVPNVVVGPDAKVYPCTSKMVRGVEALFPLEEDRRLSEKAYYDCREPDACCGCDRAFQTIHPERRKYPRIVPKGAGI